MWEEELIEFTPTNCKCNETDASWTSGREVWNLENVYIVQYLINVRHY